ncbi:hypothetical protein F4778DRAFT_790838 [Xylariomycetidae sp. FL2044]|nr:hypothetical protein F4778DRAFT_790838 [Xylariomycetidae sp. FL2044]
MAPISAAAAAVAWTTTAVATRTVPQAITKILSARQGATTTTVVSESPTSSSSSDDDGKTALSGGAIAGIVIGSIAGFLLLLWLIRSCVNLNHPEIWGRTFEPEHEKPSASYDHYARRGGSSHRHHSRHGGHHHNHNHNHRSRSRHSHRSSPRRVEVVNTTTTRPVYPEQQVQQRGRSPRAPQAVYYGDPRQARRVSSGRRYYG